MSSLGRVSGARVTSRVVAVVALAGLVTVLMGTALGATSSAKAAGPQVTFLGPAVKGKAKGVHESCTVSTDFAGVKEMFVSWPVLNVGKASYNLSLRFDGSAYKAGKHDFGAGVIVSLQPFTGSGFWGSGIGTGPRRSTRTRGVGSSRASLTRASVSRRRT
jgi:hypothetical protein